MNLLSLSLHRLDYQAEALAMSVVKPKVHLHNIVEPLYNFLEVLFFFFLLSDIL